MIEYGWGCDGIAMSQDCKIEVYTEDSESAIIQVEQLLPIGVSALIFPRVTCHSLLSIGFKRYIECEL